MSDETKMDEIQMLAYQLWEADGRPEGRNKEFWEQAQKQTLEKNNERADTNLSQQNNPPKPSMSNPIISNKK